MKFMYEGNMYESKEELNEGLFSKKHPVKPGYAKNPTLGKSAVFYYVEDAKAPGFIHPDMQNPIVNDYIEFCPNEKYAKDLKARYISVNNLPENYPVNVIKRTKEIIG